MIIVMVKMDEFLCRWPHYHHHHYHHCRHHHHLHRHHLQVNRRYETSGQAPLHIAASNGSINAIAALVAAGARLEVDFLINIILIFISKILQGEQQCPQDIVIISPFIVRSTSFSSVTACVRQHCIKAS